MLHRTPREVLASLKMSEFFAYVRLVRDRNAEQREAEREARRGSSRRRRRGATTDDVVDLSHASDEDVAAAFGAKIVRVKAGA